MPGPRSPIPPLSEAVTQEAVAATLDAYPANEVKKALLDIVSDLLGTQTQASIFGTSETDPYSPSLQTLYARLNSGHLVPSPLQAHANDEERVKETMHRRTGKKPMQRPLEDFEDVYYAALSLIKSMHGLITTRLSSDFNKPDDPVFPAFANVGDDGSETPVLTIATFQAWLAAQWTVLNAPELALALDNAVRRSRVKALHVELLTHLRIGDLTQDDADELLADLYDPEEYSGVQGLCYIGAWVPAMICAWLEEKYRVVLGVERDYVKKAARWEKKRAAMYKVEQKRQEKLAQKMKTQGAAERKKTEERLAAERERSERIVAAQKDQNEKAKREKEQWDAEYYMMRQRVGHYSAFLRGMASDGARHVVNQTYHNVQQSLYGGPVQGSGDGDVNMDVEMGNDVY